MSASNTPSSAGKAIMVVGDDHTFATRLAKAFEQRGYVTRVMHDFDSAVTAASISPPDYAVIDLQMPDRSGLMLVKRLHAIANSIHIVVLAGLGSGEATEAIKLGARDYLTKPATTDEILGAFNRAESKSPRPESARDIPSLYRVAWEHINRVLTEQHGNISRSARVLGIDRRTLQRKLHKHSARR